MHLLAVASEEGFYFDKQAQEEEGRVAEKGCQAGRREFGGQTGGEAELCPVGARRRFGKTGNAQEGFKAMVAWKSAKGQQNSGRKGRNLT